MASRIKAISAYRPKIVLGKRVNTEELVSFIARSTGLNESGVQQVLLELRDSIVFFAASGRPVKLEGLGTYTPAMEVNGKVKIGYRADTELKQRLNAEFHGEVENKDNIGKTSDELVAMWNAEHPDDQVS